jgi:probable HAF family extracellular repeat protein
MRCFITSGLPCRTRRVRASRVQPESLERRVLLSAYTVVDLGVLPGGSFSSASAVNDAGMVVGAADAAGPQHAFSYSGGGLQDLHTLPGGASSGANAVNDLGQAAGSSQVAGGDEHAFRSAPGGGPLQDIGTLPGGSFAIAKGVNNAGIVVGDSDEAGGPPVTNHAFLYDGAMHELTGFGGVFTHANAINDAGLVVGQGALPTADLSQLHARAFRYDGGGYFDLGTLGGDSSAAYAISDNGLIAGQADTGDATQHAFLYDAAGMHDLGALTAGISIARGVNNAGMVVGDPGVSVTPGYAFVYAGGQLLNLNSLIPAGSGWSLDMATGINNAGQIVGSGTINGQTHAYLLTPTTNLSVQDATGTYGGTTTLHATLTGGLLGAPLPSRPVAFTINGNPVGTAMTDASGTATLPGVSLAGLDAGNYAIGATFAGNPSVAGATGSGTLAVNRAEQTIAWAAPAAIVAGTPLGSGQLNATVSVVGPSPAGALSYAPPAGTVLGPGTRTLTVTAAATNNYNAASASVPINVTYGIKAVPDLGKAKNGGSTLPVRLALTDASGGTISGAGVTITAVGISPATASGPTMPATSPGNSFTGGVFRANNGNGDYQFDLKLVDSAGRALAGGSYFLYFKVEGDPVLHRVGFEVK